MILGRCRSGINCIRNEGIPAVNIRTLLLADSLVEKGDRQKKRERKEVFIKKQGWKVDNNTLDCCFPIINYLYTIFTVFALS